MKNNFYYKNYIILLLIIIFNVACFCYADDYNLNSIIIIDTKKIKKVSPFIWGQNTLAYNQCKPTDVLCQDDGRNSNWGAGQWNPLTNSPDKELLQLAKNINCTMLRYPGGVPANFYNWKSTIGPRENRPNFLFGLDEFMKLCRELSAEPMITLNYYSGTDQDFSDLVEYLNAPASPGNTWALKRASNGHEEPYGVKFFELGCEVYDNIDFGNRSVDPNDYANRYHRIQKILKQIDPKIMLGAVFDTSATNIVLCDILKDSIDFGIMHFYPPWYTNNDPNTSFKDIFYKSVAGANQIGLQLKNLQEDLKFFTNKNIPIAITEYNGGFVQDKPLPYRHCLGNAILNADLLRVFMTSKATILSANYWQFSNSYWGLTYNNNFMDHSKFKHNYLRPNYLMFKLFKEHFSNNIVETTVDSARYKITDFNRVFETSDVTSDEFNNLNKHKFKKITNWNTYQNSDVLTNIYENEIHLNFFKNKDLNYFHTYSNLIVDPSRRYLLLAKIRTDNLTSKNGICLEVQDERGWDKIKWAVSSNSVLGDSDWKTVALYFSPFDNETKLINVIIRRFVNGGSINGSAVVKDVKIVDLGPRVEYEHTPFLSAISSLSDDGRVLYLIVINKNFQKSINASIFVDSFNFYNNIDYWILSGESIQSNNENNKYEVVINNKKFKSAESNSINFNFPPHSIVAIELLKVN